MFAGADTAKQAHTPISLELKFGFLLVEDACASLSLRERERENQSSIFLYLLVLFQ